MVATLLLINPIEKTTGKRGVKKMAKAKRKSKPSAAQLAARKKFADMVRAKSAAKKAGKKSSGKKKSKRKSVSKKTRSEVRSMKNIKHHVAGYYPNPVRKHMKKRRRNPIGKMGLPSVKSVKDNLLVPAAVGAVGAVVIDIVAGYLPLPASMTVGNMRYVRKAAVIIALGVLAGKVVGKKQADMAVVGGLTVMFHGIVKDFATKNFAGVMPMAGMDDLSGVDLYSPGLLSGDDVDMLNQYMPADRMAGMDAYFEASGMNGTTGFNNA